MPAKYLITLADVAQIPDLFKKGGFMMGYAQSRIAFVGRSNVGKSSLINALTQQQVARVSATPGKTRAIHFFLWDRTDKIVVDLPGYGFAKVAKTDMREWVRLLDSYFNADEKLEVVMMLFDSRHGPTDQDLEALEFFASKQLPIQIIMTKFDQLKTQSERGKRKKEVEAALAPYSVTEENIVWVSVKDQRTLEFLRKTLT
jgi:GTP-binding protein